MPFDCLSTNELERIHRAVRHGRVFTLETYLNRSSADVIEQRHDYGRSRWTLLIAACFYQHEAIVRMLLRRFQPDVDAVGDVQLDFIRELMYGVSPLWVAVALGHLGIVRLLVEQGRANVNHSSVTHSSPLRAATFIGRLDIVRYLVDHGADVKLARHGNYNNLMLSAYRQHRALIKYYIDELHCDPNEQDQDGRMPLHYAIDAGSLPVIRLLLERGARNDSRGCVCPMFTGALTGREDFVDVFQHVCSSAEQWIEARELLGASLANVESRNYDLSKAIEHLTLANRWRMTQNLVKRPVPHPSMGTFISCRESQTLLEFNECLSQSNHRLHIESLLIQERILGAANTQFRRTVRFYGDLLADTEQYARSLCLRLYELAVQRQSTETPDKWHVRHIVHLLANMINNDVDPLPEQALVDILTVLADELAHARDRDHHLMTLCHLSTVISHVSSLR
jgi:Fem-1 homolog b